MPGNLIYQIALITLVTLLVLPAGAQAPKDMPAPGGREGPENEEAVSAEQPATFEVAPTSGKLKETVQKGQQLAWRGRGSPGEPRFEVSNISIAFLRDESPSEVRMTFAAQVSALGWRPADEAKLNVIVRTKGGTSIHSWTLDVSIRCADNNRALSPMKQEVPRDIAANLFSNIGEVEVSEYREPNMPRLTARRCQS